MSDAEAVDAAEDGRAGMELIDDAAVVDVEQARLRRFDEAQAAIKARDDHRVLFLERVRVALLTIEPSSSAMRKPKPM